MKNYNDHPFYDELELWIDLYKTPSKVKKKRGNQLKKDERPQNQEKSPNDSVRTPSND